MHFPDISRVPVIMVLVALSVLILSEPTDARAHGAGWQAVGNENTVRYRFGYTDGSPMGFAEVIVTAPDGNIWQKARTDRSGHFAFALDQPGGDITQPQNWHIRVGDGMGHVVQLTHQSKPDITSDPPTPTDQTVPVANTKMRGTAAIFDLPVWAGMLFGLSVLANLYGGLLLWGCMRKAHQS
ncbi:carboxypeptidase-like regulatory domain-containing protein [Thalassospira povalilytica]|uniref:carboxypeptidase-like regulatory domain-containing protein n=1 Tax=Thalassospira povalilytica TaxID=732237 RepID=UPI003AA8EF27